MKIDKEKLKNIDKLPADGRRELALLMNKHDQIFENEMLATLEDKTLDGPGCSKHWDIVRKNLNWFRQHNAKAYMVLLD